MVTEIIKNEDIDSAYSNPIRWIRVGITNDAVLVFRTQWKYADDKKPFFITQIRNINAFYKNNINPVNKW